MAVDLGDVTAEQVLASGWLWLEDAWGHIAPLRHPNRLGKLYGLNAPAELNPPDLTIRVDCLTAESFEAARAHIRGLGVEGGFLDFHGLVASQDPAHGGH